MRVVGLCAAMAAAAALLPGRYGRRLDGNVTNSSPPSTSGGSSGGGGEGDVGYPFMAVALCTLIAAPFSLVAGIAGTATGRGKPIEFPSEGKMCCCVACLLPCRWEPLTLCRVCLFYACVNLILASISLALWIYPWTAVVSSIGGACFALNAAAARLLYLPRWRLRRLLPPNFN